MFFGKMLTFLYQVFIFSIGIMNSLNFLFSFSVGRIQVVVQPEELDDTGNVNNRNEYPNKHALVEKELAHC